MIMANRNLLMSGLLLALGIQAACSNRIARPIFGKNGDSNIEAPTTDDTHSGTKTPAKTVDTQALKAVAEQILAPQNPNCSATSTGEAPAPNLRLLTKVEYNNTVKDVLGVARDYAADFPVEQRILGFMNNSTTTFASDSHMDAYMVAAKNIAKEVVAGNFQGIAGCAVTAGESCATTVINTLAPKIWRRPVTKEESARMLALFKNGAADGNDAGFILLLRGLLSSPNFLYRSELGNAGTLTAAETAHALSYFFWGTVPDDELRKLADSGEILKGPTLLAQANRLIASPKTKVGLKEFADAFLRYNVHLTIPKDAAKYPQYSPAIRDAMALETEDTFDYWIRVKGAKFQDLYSADYSVGNAALATYYGATTMTENNAQLLSFANQKRRGLLGLGSLMASLSTTVETNPIKRGTFVREHLLCEILPQPTGLDIPPVPVTPGLSTRERFAAHTAIPSCKSCHVRIDGVGFGMEDYDAVGMMRDNDSGKPLDASGSMVDVDGKDATFTGTEGLSAVLKDSERAKRCFVLQAFRSSAGRFETTGDVCAIRAIADEFVQKDTTLADVLIKVITNPSLLKRKGL